MGYTVLVNGEYELSTHDMKMTYHADHTDNPYQVYMDERGSNIDMGYKYDMQGYNFHLDVCKSH